jgi:hypothetical protein
MKSTTSTSTPKAQQRKVVNQAVENNSVQLLRKYHAQGINVFDCEATRMGVDTEKSIVLAGWMGKGDIIKVLVSELGCDVNTKNSKDITAFHMAAC